MGGKTAETVDYFDAVTNPTPYVLAFVLGLSFIVLTVAFRSIVVALVSIALNLLSVAAAYGLLTLVFLAASARACSASSTCTPSTPGCRCSSSPCCSRSRWTTRCS